MNINRLHTQPANRGVVLILTLWIVTVLSLVAYSLAFEMRLEVRLTKLKKDNLIAHQLAKAGMAKAVCDLKNDMVIDRSEDFQVLDAEGDVWKNPEDKINIEMGGGSYSVKIIDEESFLNLNSVNALVIVETVKYFWGEDLEEEAKKIARAVVDWRDADDIPIENGAGMKERDFYRQYMAEDMGLMDYEDVPFSYRLKNDHFTTVEELLDVYGVTQDLFYGYDPAERKEEYISGRDRESSSDNIHIMSSSRESSEYNIDLVPEGVRDMYTVHSNGLVNINTAGESVLTVILAAANISDPKPEDMAKAIIDFRRDSAKEDIDNDQAFRNVGELSQVEGLSGPMISRLQSLQRLTTTSSNFRIIAEGNYGSAHRTIEAVVSRKWETFNVDTTEEDFDPDVRRRIKREDENKSEDKITVESPTVRIVRLQER